MVLGAGLGPAGQLRGSGEAVHVTDLGTNTAARLTPALGMA